MHAVHMVSIKRSPQHPWLVCMCMTWKDWIRVLSVIIFYTEDTCILDDKLIPHLWLSNLVETNDKPERDNVRHLWQIIQLEKMKYHY